MQLRVSTDRQRIAHGLVVITLFALVRLASRSFPRGALGLALGVVSALGFFVGLFYFGLLRVGGIGLRELGWRRHGAVVDVVRGAVGTIVLMLGLVVVAALFYPPANETARAIVAAVVARSWHERAQLLAMGALASFVEESLFRGYLQPPLMRRCGDGLGLVIVAALFALAHCEFAPPRLVALFVQGVGFGVLRGRTHSLWASATAHSLLWSLMP